MKTTPPVGEANARKRHRAILLMALVLVLLLLAVGASGSLFLKEYSSHLVSPPQVEWPDFLPLPTLVVVGAIASPILLILLGFYAFTLYNSTLLLQRIPGDEGASELPVPPRSAYRRTLGCLTGLLALATVLGVCADGMLLQVPRIYDTTGTLYLDSVAMASPQQAWAIGNFQLSQGGFYSVIEQYHAGQWTQVSNPARKDILRSLSMLPDGDAWAVGNAGIILHEQNGIWTRMLSPTRAALMGVAMVSPREGWAVGQDSTLLHFPDGRWTIYPLPGKNYLAAITMLSPNEGWIAGDIMLHYSNGTWTQVPAPIKTDETLFALAALPHGDPQGWAAGSHNTVLQERQGVWSAAPPMG